MVSTGSDAKAILPAGSRSFAGWRMLIIAFLAQNCAIGMNFGVYGTIVSPLQDHFGTSRALAASGLAFMTLSMGLLSPVVGSLMQRYSLKVLMLSGAALNALGYVLLAYAPSIYAVLAIYTFVVGPGVCLLGVIPSSTLINNWFAAGRGRALGFVNTPAFVSLFPIITASMVQALDLRGVFIMVALIFVALLPLLMMVVTTPADVGQHPLGGSLLDEGSRPESSAKETHEPARGMSGRDILLHPSFQIIWIGIGTLTAGGVMMTTHLVPLAMDKGLDMQSAALLLSAFGVAASIGSLLFGWLADRIGGARALVVQSLSWTLPWMALLFLDANILGLLLVSASIGVMSGGIVGLLGVIANSWLGPENFGRVMGYVYFFKVPFLFGAAPFAGFLFDRTGSYDLTLIIHIVSFVCVGMMFILYKPKPLTS